VRGAARTTARTEQERCGATTLSVPAAPLSTPKPPCATVSCAGRYASRRGASGGDFSALAPPAGAGWRCPSATSGRICAVAPNT
jgi:hypothetical protein